MRININDDFMRRNSKDQRLWMLYMADVNMYEGMYSYVQIEIFETNARSSLYVRANFEHVFINLLHTHVARSMYRYVISFNRCFCGVDENFH